MLLIACIVLAVALSACAVVHTGQPVRVALLAPFEGRYREVGYNALYAARLALREQDNPLVELLPVDDGGSLASAADRARALVHDPQVIAVIALGYDATDAETQTALADIPLLAVGHWSAALAGERAFILASPQLDALLTAPPHVSVTDAARLPAPVVGGDVFALDQFPRLRQSLDGIEIVSSGRLPDADFAARYRGSDPFAPEPGLLATLTYDAAQIIVRAVQAGARSRADVQRYLSSMEYTGINGGIRFDNGYWANAPIHRYRFDESGALTPLE